MTQERFSRIVDDPDLLRTITYEELKTLALAYPYAHNLRYLLAIKSRQIEHQDVVKNVATAAAYSLDRSQLFRLVAPQMIAPQEVWIEEEMLELKPIETLKRKLEEELTAVSRAEKQVTTQVEAAIDPQLEQEAIAESVPVFIPESVFSEEIEAATLPQIPYQNFSAWFGKFHQPVLESAVKVTLATSAEIALAPAPEPSVTLEQVPEFQPIEVEEEEVDTVLESPKVAGIAQILAEKSVAENKDVISETLAKLYAKQGYRDKAVIMYERLGLAFPEKSAYFAAEIDKLKK